MTVAGYTQEEISTPGKEYAEGIFTGTLLINSQTTTTLLPRSWSFGIQHRFGQIGLDSTLYKNFLGLDLPSVIRFSFGRALTDRWSIEIGRTNHLKTYDFETKYLLLKQTTDFKMPISMAVYFNAAYRSEDFPEAPENAFFEDGLTPFEYKPAHRFTYNSQVIISSKLSDKVSVQLTPIVIYRNLTEPFTDNFTIVLSSGFRYKIGFSSSLVGEYAYLLNNRVNEFNNPFSLGVEFGTAGHTFQVFISSASRILESQIYGTQPADILDGKFLLGFNLKRVFWRKVKSE